MPQTHSWSSWSRALVRLGLRGGGPSGHSFSPVFLLAPQTPFLLLSPAWTPQTCPLGLVCLLRSPTVSLLGTCVHVWAWVCLLFSPRALLDLQGQDLILRGASPSPLSAARGLSRPSQPADGCTLADLALMGLRSTAFLAGSTSSRPDRQPPP